MDFRDTADYAEEFQFLDFSAEAANAEHDDRGAGEAVGAALARLARRTLGLCALLAGLAGLIALGASSPFDPSWNAASGGEPANWLGARGAVFADLTQQGLGWAAAAALWLLTFAGARYAWLARPAARPRLRWASLAAAPILAALSLSFWPAAAAWPYQSGMGGLVGAGLQNALVWAVSPALGEGWLAHAVIAGGAHGGALLAFGWGMGVVFSRLPAVSALELIDWPALAERWGLDRFGWIVRLARFDPSPLRAALAGLWTRWTRPAAPQRAGHAATTPRKPPLAVPVRPMGVANDNDGYDEDDDFSDAEDGAGAGDALDLKALFGDAPARPRARKTRAKAFAKPSLDLLSEPERREAVADPDLLRDQAERLSQVLADFGVKGQVTRAKPGPVITLFEFEPTAGARASRIVALSDDVARAMGAPSARIAPLPARTTLGVELPNEDRCTVYLRALLQSPAFQKSDFALPIALGETIDGEPFIADLAKTPHLLIAGTTGSGKSVGVNAMILSLMFRHKPEDCRFIMIDPKILEFKPYEDCPHLMAPVVTDPKDAVTALKWAVREMERRYRAMAEVSVRNIAGFNARVRTTGEGEKLPYLVVVIDEMADLMIVAGKDVEALVQRLAQMARAAGIHVIMSTQRPSVDVITGTIKANFPARISYQVTTKIDSRTILGEQGAEQLLGKGDLLYMPSGSKARRLHGPFVSDDEVETVAAYLKTQGKPDYADILEPDPDEDGADFALDGGDGGDLYDQAVAIVLRDKKASTSYIQRRLGIGYNRAASLMERMEDEGVVSAAGRAGKRDILVGGAEG